MPEQYPDFLQEEQDVYKRQAYTLKEIDETMIPDLEKVTDDPNIQVQTVANSNQVIFKTQTLDLEKREAFAKYMADEFGVEEKDITTENISSTVSSEMRVDAIIAVAIATVFMLLYIWLRFKDVYKRQQQCVACWIQKKS